ncbi:LysM peptidoglycan-binding domain-containing protein [Bacillus sp. z60-18]|uniref:LysM peptidoglycan-binding domain-containing protein n=1 Tax=Bacillus sp. HSf4 TaxID=3035514 RepID=UPI0003FD2A84|nr:MULTISPECIES: LysM peptidoglycan-binding domain-containing protein [Bacillus]QHZ47927.1 LysM peptidoglycan-binding domain-containing protein [Bacillus sp. NSP9.1]WFA04008.1 LysM peptidoglycan-binding domain-containing protein [Bacillus sp. HSf4]
MPQNNRLQFSVEESICFQKGQEVSELLSISLDPDISVQEVNDYVSIRGSLELTGEYNIDQTREYAELPATSRFVEDVKLKGDSSAELTHCFPVDITIPKNKVSHLNDVFVFIDAFDYQLTDARMLTIQADLAIEGLLDVAGDADETEEADVPVFEDAQQAEESFEPVYRDQGEEEELNEIPLHLDTPYDEQAVNQRNEETDDENVPIYQSFLSDDEHEAKPFFTASLSAAERAKREWEGQKEPADSLEDAEAQKESAKSAEEAEPELEREESEEQKEEEPVYRTYQNHEESNETPFFGDPPLLEDEDEEREPDSFDIEVTQESSEEEEAAHSIEIPEYSFHEQTEPEEEARDEADIHEASAKENDNALYLTKLFTKEGEEEFSRMRMCIVQQNDTIDLLCERYDINVQQLIRMNSLSLDEELKEGQILYIPDYHNSHA